MDRCELDFSPGHDFLSQVLAISKDFEFNIYDSLIAAELMAVERVASVLGLAQDSLLLFSGGFDALKSFMLLNNGSEVLIPDNSFFGYRELSIQTHCRVVEAEWSFLLNADCPKIICLPNNPGGESLNLAELLENKSTNSFIDATYCFFDVLLEDVNIWPELVKGRIFNVSLSKSFGMAGLRSSICIGDPRLISLLRKYKTPYSVGILQSISVFLYFSSQWYDCRVGISERISNLRRFTVAELNRLSVSYVDPKSNFLLLLGDVPTEIKEICSLKNGLVRLTLNDRNAGLISVFRR